MDGTPTPVCHHISVFGPIDVNKHRHSMEKSWFGHKWDINGKAASVIQYEWVKAKGPFKKGVTFSN